MTTWKLNHVLPDGVHNFRHWDVWWGDYLGVKFEIRKRKPPEHEPEGHGWVHYVYLSERQVPDELLNEVFVGRKDSGYFDCYASILARADWPGGITYYDMERDVPGDRWIRVGCDYMHSWDADEGYPYDLDHVLYETMATIRSLVKIIPGLRNINGDTIERPSIDD